MERKLENADAASTCGRLFAEQSRCWGRICHCRTELSIRWLASRTKRLNVNIKFGQNFSASRKIARENINRFTTFKGSVRAWQRVEQLTLAFDWAFHFWRQSSQRITLWHAAHVEFHTWPSFWSRTTLPERVCNWCSKGNNSSRFFPPCSAKH